MCARWSPPPSIDFFATKYYYRLPRYVSQYPDPAAWAFYTLSICWENLVAYAFPPTLLIGAALQKAATHPCTHVLITLLCTTRPWFPSLLDLLVALPCALTQ